MKHSRCYADKRVFIANADPRFPRVAERDCDVSGFSLAASHALAVMKLNLLCVA